MRHRRIASGLLTLVILCSQAAGQTPTPTPDADKEKKAKEQNERIVQMLDQAVADAETLRLPQNRAIVFAMTGDLLWKFDQKRARELFRTVAAELISHNQEAEKERRESTNPMADFFDFAPESRSEVLPLIAKHDAELALEVMVQTRSAKLLEAINREQAGTKAAPDVMNTDRFRVRQELALEQQFALLAADQDPEKAIRLIKDSLSRGVSAGVLTLLQKLHKKDEKKAAELAGLVIKKLVDTDLTKTEDVSTALSFLQFAFKAPTGKEFKFTDEQVKDLANKLANSLLQGAKGSIAMTGILNQAMPILTKFVPDKAAQLKQRQADNEAATPAEYRRITELQRLYDPNTSAEELLAQLPKLTDDFSKVTAYQSLASKISEITDDERAKKLIDQIPDEKQKATVQEAFEAARVGRAAGAGKLDDARRMIGNLTKKKVQIQRLVDVAIQFHKKGGEKDIENATALMKDARALASEYPETYDEIADVMEVIRGYAQVDPIIAFSMFEPMIDKFTEHVHASATLAKFSPEYSTFRRGELILKVSARGTNSPLFLYSSHIQTLGKADLEKMNVLADRFGRSDCRTIARLYILQGFLRDDKNPNEPPRNASMNIVF